MIPKTRVFGVVLMATIALCAVIAQGASADPLTVNGGASGNTFYTGLKHTTTHHFKTPHGTVTCATQTFTATSTGASVNHLSVTPEYKECVAFGFATAHVKHNGCVYTFTTPTNLGGGSVTWGPSQIHIVCPAGKSIEITPTSFGVSVCTQFIGTQTPTGGHIIGTNAGGVTPDEMDVTLDITLTGIHYTGDGGPCTNAETHSDAEYFGTTTLKAYSNAGHTVQRGITFS